MTKTIMDLFEEFKGKKVWVYIPNELKKDFYRELKDNDFKFISGKKVSRFSIENYMSIRSNKTTAYISYLSWNMGKTYKDVVHINYKKFLNDEEYVLYKDIVKNKTMQ